MHMSRHTHSQKDSGRAGGGCMRSVLCCRLQQLAVVSGSRVLKRTSGAGLVSVAVGALGFPTGLAVNTHCSRPPKQAGRSGFDLGSPQLRRSVISRTEPLNNKEAVFHTGEACLSELDSCGHVGRGRGCGLAGVWAPCHCARHQGQDGADDGLLARGGEDVLVGRWAPGAPQLLGNRLQAASRAGRVHNWEACQSNAKAGGWASRNQGPLARLPGHSTGNQQHQQDKRHSGGLDLRSWSPKP